MPIINRPARSEDLARADELVVGSINDLTERHGFGKIASPRPPPFQLFSLKVDPDGLWVAEDGGQMVSFAWSWVCGDFWFLARLFVSPARIFPAIRGSCDGNVCLPRQNGPASPCRDVHQRRKADIG
jgi:hypothetical protein